MYVVSSYEHHDTFSSHWDLLYNLRDQIFNHMKKVLVVGNITLTLTFTRIPQRPNNTELNKSLL